MRITTLLTALIAFFIVVSCGKATPESETKRWEASQKTLTSLSAKYPGFKPALKEVKKTAKSQWEAAANISEEEKQIEAMRAANSAAAPKFVRNLDDMSDKMEALKDLMTAATQAGGTDQADKDALATAKREADMSLGKAEKTLMNGKATTMDAADAIVSEVVKELESATNRIKKVMETVKNKKGEAEAEADSAAAKTEAEANAKKSIKCGHCGNMNPHDALKCGSCGAPVEQ